MIYFPEIDLKNKNIRIILFILIILFLFLNHLETRALLSILVVFVIINQFSLAKENIHRNLFENDKGNNIVNYNNKIEGILLKIKKYQKKSPYNYQQGMHYWKLFLRNINMLENDELYMYNQYFENAHQYLITSVNIFQGLGIEAEERKNIDAAKFNHFNNSEELMEITGAIKELYTEAYTILYNLSIRLNKKWEKNPHVFNKEIVFNVPSPYEKMLTNFDYY